MTLLDSLRLAALVPLVLVADMPAVVSGPVAITSRGSNDRASALRVSVPSSEVRVAVLGSPVIIASPAPAAGSPALSASPVPSAAGSPALSASPVPSAASAPAPPAPDPRTAAPAAERGGWDSLRFLLGEWEAAPRADQSTGRFSFSIDLGGALLVRRNHAEYPAREGRPASTHDDQMYIYREGDTPSLRAIYFDTEGHVIHYATERLADGQVTFVSDATPGAPRFRLSYTKTADGKLNGSFEIAPPGKPDAFSKYLEWVGQRPAAAPSSKP